MTTAVVVPTRDRPGALRHCLAALDAQRRTPDLVVVVDDGSLDGAAVAAVVAAATTPTRLLRADGRGPAAARNLGARAAGTEVVCFTDDDCRPAPEWIERLLDGLAGAAAAAGPTLPEPGASAAVRAAQTVTNHLVTSSLDRTTGTVAFAPTSNLAVRATTFAQHPFDEDFPLAAGEDRAWCDDLVAGGDAIAYVPEAVVEHHPALDLPGFWRQQVRYGRGAHRYRQRAPVGPRPGAGWYAALVRAGFRQGPAVGALVATAQVATVVGYATEAVGRGRR